MQSHSRECPDATPGFSAMDAGMAPCAERDQVLFGVAAGVTPKLVVMYLTPVKLSNDWPGSDDPGLFCRAGERNPTASFSSALLSRSLQTRQAHKQACTMSQPDSKKILLNLIAQQVSQSVTVLTNFTAGLKK